MKNLFSSLGAFFNSWYRVAYKYSTISVASSAMHLEIQNKKTSPSSLLQFLSPGLQILDCFISGSL